MIWLTWVLDLLAVLLSVVAGVLNKRDVKAYQHEDVLFGRICLISVMVSIIKLVEDTIAPGNEMDSLGYVSIVFDYLFDILDIVMLFYWILFVDFMIYRSMDHLRVLMPGIIKILTVITFVETTLTVEALYTRYMIEASLTEGDGLLPLIIWMVLTYYVLKGVLLILLLYSIKELVAYRKRRIGPLMFRGIPFYIPVAFGCIITIVLNYRIDLNPVAGGIGVFLLFFSMRAERRYVDGETGFFTTEYLTLLSRVDEKRRYGGGLGILITVDDGTDAFIDILKRARPREVDVIRASEDVFFLVGERKSKSVVEFFLNNLKEVAEEEGVHLTVRYGLRGEMEDAGTLFERLDG